MAKQVRNNRVVKDKWVKVNVTAIPHGYVFSGIGYHQYSSYIGPNSQPVFDDGDYQPDVHCHAYAEGIYKVTWAHWAVRKNQWYVADGSAGRVYISHCPWCGTELITPAVAVSGVPGVETIKTTAEKKEAPQPILSRFQRI